MGIFNDFNKKEKPVFTGLRFGFGSGGGGAGAPVPASPFTAKIVLVGGGGQVVIAQGGGGGGAGAVGFFDYPITIAYPYSLRVGSGGISPEPGRMDRMENILSGSDAYRVGEGGNGGNGGPGSPQTGGNGTEQGGPGGGGYTPGGGGALIGGVSPLVAFTLYLGGTGNGNLAPSVVVVTRWWRWCPANNNGQNGQPGPKVRRW